jgi:Plasmid pRiA4b ORF-3-like protein
MAPRKSTKNTNDPLLYQVKITLKDVRPPIWRRIEVYSSTTLGLFHEIIQTAMGWTDSHLHQFTINNIEYGHPQPEFEFDVEDEALVKLSQVVTGEKFKFLYTYDFGDGWDHEILVEKILLPHPENDYPFCIKGKRACPPEDCGGAWGYSDLLAALQDPEHPEHEEKLEWVGEDFDPAAFDLEETNQVLAEFSRSPLR